MNHFPKPTQLTSYEQFVELSNKFDKEIGTKTFWCRIPMKNIYSDILFEDSCWDIDYQIKKWENVFSIKQEFYQDDLDIPQSQIGKMNSIWLMLNDLKNNKKFYSPITMSLFKNGNKPIHPGTTRLILTDVYDYPVDLCITDYIGNIREKYTGIKFFDVEDYFYDFSNGLHELHEDITSSGWCPTYASNTDEKDLRIKQISTYMQPTTDMFNYHHPRQAETHRKYCLKDNIISVNDMPIAIKKDNIWQIVFKKD